MLEPLLSVSATGQPAFSQVASFPAPQVLADTSVGHTGARNARRRIALGVSVPRELGTSTCARSMKPTRAVVWLSERRRGIAGELPWLDAMTRAAKKSKPSGRAAGMLIRDFGTRNRPSQPYPSEYTG